MSNSELVDVVVKSTHYAKDKVKNVGITIHHMAGVMTAENCGKVFCGTRNASSNYGIGCDGKIGLYVDEKYRAFTSSSKANDIQMVTIEVSNASVGGNWYVSDLVFNRLIDLCVDICKRNNIPRLNYTGDKKGNLTLHKWFSATACPGPYLESRMSEIASLVNARLEEKPEPVIEQPKDIEKVSSDKGVPMYRMYNMNNGEHFFASHYEEANNLYHLGWHYEGISFISPFNGVDVHRLYNPNGGVHHYTITEGERDYLTSLGWKYEGVACYSGGNVPIYRVYNPNDGNHHYTKYKNEVDNLVSLGWQDEGIAWYCVE